MLTSLMSRSKISISNSQNDADIDFCLIQMANHKNNPMLLRLDGIYFNSEQGYTQQNEPIKYAYEKADHVVFQSKFNKKLTEHWFGKKDSSSIIHNAADLNLIERVKTDHLDENFNKNTEVWACASSWRPHKRLADNLEYFLINAPSDAKMIVAGANADSDILKEYTEKTNNRVFYAGNLDYYNLISVYKRSSTFVHLAYLDHCPNVVVDAQAAGCKIICSSTGGTKEIVTNGTMINEATWDFSPIPLYKPPEIDFDNKTAIKKHHNPNDIEKTADMYYQKFVSIVK